MLLSLTVCKLLGVIGRCCLPCGCDMADDFAIVADGIATFCCYCGRWKAHFEIIDDVFDCGRWNSHCVNG